MTHEDQPIESEIWMPPSQPFYFDPEKMVFTLGFPGLEKICKPEDLQEFGDIDRDRFEEAKETNPNTTETLVKVPFGPIIQMPSGRRILQEINGNEKNKKETIKKVRRVMMDVYKSSSSRISTSVDKSKSAFEVYFFEDGTFRLKTLGDCSCLGIDGIATERYVPDGVKASEMLCPLEFVDHNAFSNAEMFSLYAGAGTIGWITKQEAQKRA